MLLSWLDKKLRKPFELIFYGEKPTQAEAISLLNVLANESPKLIEGIVGSSKYNVYFPVKKISGPWADGCPKGIADYYMADTYINTALMLLSNIQNSNSGSVHMVVGRGGHILFLIDPLHLAALHPAVDNEKLIAIALINGGFLEKAKEGFSCNKVLYMMKARVPPQKINDLWWDPFESAMVISTILLKRLLFAAVPSLDVSCFINYGKFQFKNSGMQHPLWPFNSINLLAFNWVNLSNIKSLQCSEFSLGLLKQFDFEVQKYI